MEFSSYCPSSHEKAVYFFESSSRAICQYPDNMSPTENILDPFILRKHTFALDTGYSSLMVTSLSLRPSKQTLGFPSAFGTTNSGEFHGLVASRISPCRSLFCTNSRTASRSFGFREYWCWLIGVVPGFSSILCVPYCGSIGRTSSLNTCPYFASTFRIRSWCFSDSSTESSCFPICNSSQIVRIRSADVFVQFGSFDGSRSSAFFHVFVVFESPFVGSSDWGGTPNSSSSSNGSVVTIARTDAFGRNSNFNGLIPFRFSCNTPWLGRMAKPSIPDSSPKTFIPMIISSSNELVTTNQASIALPSLAASLTFHFSSEGTEFWPSAIYNKVLAASFCTTWSLLSVRGWRVDTVAPVSTNANKSSAIRTRSSVSFATFPSTARTIRRFTRFRFLLLIHSGFSTSGWFQHLSVECQSLR